MPTLPTPGGDNGTWGTELNEFLEVAHAADGQLRVSEGDRLYFGDTQTNYFEYDSSWEGTAASVLLFNTYISTSNGAFWTERAAVDLPAFGSNVAGDPHDRLQIYADGTIWWGPGDATRDVYFGRDPVIAPDGIPTVYTNAHLFTFASLWSERTDVGHNAFGAYLTSDTFDRFSIKAGGEIIWGPGTAAQDVNLYRIWEGGLKTDGSLVSKYGYFVDLDPLADSILAAWDEGVAQHGFEIDRNGKIWWGDGVAALDTDLYRSAADVLKTDDKLHVVLELEVDGALNHDGSTVGFYGTAPVAKQTGVAVSAAGIHAALVNLGLIAA